MNSTMAVALAAAVTAAMAVAHGGGGGVDEGDDICGDGGGDVGGDDSVEGIDFIGRIKKSSREDRVEKSNLEIESRDRDERTKP